MNMLWNCFRKVVEQEKLTNEWRYSTIVPVYKERWYIQECGNYRGVNLIIEKRIREETTIGEGQFGFMSGTS